LEGKLKKQLLTTTALAVAGALVMSGPIFVMASGDAFAQAKKKKATKPVFTLGGGWETTFGFADQEAKVVGDKTGFDVHNSTEVYFQVNHLLDNGIRIKGRVELEGQQSGDQIDETWFAVSGAFGEVRIGSEDPVTDLMVGGYSGNKATGVGHNTNLSLDDWIAIPSGHTAGRTLDIDAGFGDAEKIAYFTPRIEGLQLGVSYMPNGAKDASSSIPNNSTSVHDGWALAANYTRKIDKIAIGVAVGYVTGKKSCRHQPAGERHRRFVGVYHGPPAQVRRRDRCGGLYEDLQPSHRHHRQLERSLEPRCELQMGRERGQY